MVTQTGGYNGTTGWGYSGKRLGDIVVTQPGIYNAPSIVRALFQQQIKLLVSDFGLTSHVAEKSCAFVSEFTDD